MVCVCMSMCVEAKVHQSNASAPYNGAGLGLYMSTVTPIQHTQIRLHLHSARPVQQQKQGVFPHLSAAAAHYREAKSSLGPREAMFS